jgi:hypothetical protein
VREEFLSLSPAERRAVHDLLVEDALARWKAYADGEGEIHYRESVVGTEQLVDADLPADALAAARSGQGIAAVAQRYGEPRSALQDGDLTFPEAVEFAYYAVYNFFRKYARHEDVDDWLIVNQAVSSEEDETKWKRALAGAMEKARHRKP